MQEPTMEVCEDMEISREAEPEVKINFKKMEDLYLENEEGDSIRFGDIYKDKKTIIILIRVRIFSMLERVVYICLATETIKKTCLKKFFGGSMYVVVCK